MTDEEKPPAPPAEDFATLLEQDVARKNYTVGSIARGVVVQIGPQEIYLDIGAKSEATIPTAELHDENGALNVKVGDTVEATVVKTTADGIILSRRLLKGAQAMEQLETAFRAGIPVQGRVAGVIKGGFEVQISGARAFCPQSQIDVKRGEDPKSYVGQTFDFKIIEFRERGKNLVVSRRKLLEGEAAALAEQTWKVAVPGAVLKGRIVSLADFGAFVDLGGVQGLVHISEISHERVARPADLLKPGQEVSVKVVKVDTEKGRISLSMKALEENPWDAAAGRLTEGDQLRGKLMRVVDFGAFVQVAPGVDGLIHSSQATPELMAEWKRTTPEHPEMEVRVLSIDRDRRRISLAPVL
jgi:small subunit ribosomal protein S1